LRCVGGAAGGGDNRCDDDDDDDGCDDEAEKDSADEGGCGLLKTGRLKSGASASTAGFSCWSVSITTGSASLLGWGIASLSLPSALSFPLSSSSSSSSLLSSFPSFFSSSELISAKTPQKKIDNI
jgi:hypothetical protein